MLRYTACTQPWSTTVHSGGTSESESSTAPEDLTWEEWGPHHTHCFVDIGGRRLFYSQKIEMDFNEFEVSRVLCRTGNLARLKSRELQAQMHDKDPAQAVTEVAAEVSGDPGRRIVLNSSVIRGVFTKDVVTWLPYRMTEIFCDQVNEAELVFVSAGEIHIARTRDVTHMRPEGRITHNHKYCKFYS